MPDAPDDGPPTPLPATVGGFRIDRVLGRGGMGVVYAAHDPHLGRPVAVKVMRDDWPAGPVLRERFRREARAAAAVHHDHIVPVLQVGEDDGQPFLVMPLLAGQTLAARLRAGPVSLAEAVDIARQAAAGLAAAHAAGVIHRDIKPANLFLEDRPGGGVRVRVLDFGLARSATEDGGLTAPGEAVGTPAYAAPERVADHRSDVYALGGVLFTLLAGRRPDAHPLPAAVPPRLAALVRAMLATDPAGRPATAGAVAAELAAVSAPPPRRRWQPFAAVAVGLAALAGYAATRPGRTPQPDPAPAPPAFARGTALPPPATDFDVLADATPAELERWATALGPRGLRPDGLSVRDRPGDPRFTAVAVADGRPGAAWVALDLDDAAWVAKAQPLLAAGLRPVAAAGIAGSARGLDGWLGTTFWARPADPGGWGCMGSRGHALLDDKHAHQVDRGRRLTRLTATGTAPPLWYGTVYSPNHPNHAHDWAVNLSRVAFDADHRNRTAGGYRLDALDATSTPTGPAFHAIWVSDGGTSDFALDLTRDQLDAQLADRRAARSRPYTLAAYDTPDGLRYAVTWVPMDPAAGK